MGERAAEQGRRRRTLLAPRGAVEAFSSVPYFWSNQYDQRIQYVGAPAAFSRVVEGAIGDPKFVAVFELDGRLAGAICVNAPARMVKYRRLIAAGHRDRRFDDAL